MITWNFKKPLAAVALGLLATCGGTETGLFSGLAGTTSGNETPLRQVTMAGGAVSLVAPDGYCVDRRGLRARFVLMARCDTLGAVDLAGDAPLGLITVSLSAADPAGDLPAPQVTAAALDLTDIANIETGDNLVLYRATGPVPTEEVDPRHWRATTLIARQLLSIALFGPRNGRAVSDEGRGIVQAFIDRTRAAN